MPDDTLITPEAPVADGAAAAPAPAPAAGAEAAAGETLITPESAQDGGAAASDQGGADGAAAPSGQSEDQAPSGEAGADDAPEGAPDAYADFTMPEGFTLPPELGEGLTALAKELNLPQAKAQKMVDLGIAQATAIQKAMADQFATTRAGWADAVRNDPVIGGANLNVNMAVAKKAIVAFGTPALTGFLNATGLGQHPDFLRFAVNVGAAISEDTIENGGQGPSGGARQRGERDHAKSLYPGMK